MVAQIPLLWQLTDLFCAMGLGFLYGFLYLLLCGLLRKKPAAPFAAEIPRVFGTEQRLRRRRQLQKKLRKTVVFLAQALFAFTCCIFTRAWVLTASRAAQLRWSMLVGVVLGFRAFFAGMLPVLKHVQKKIARICAPVRKLCGGIAARSHRHRLQARERHRLRFQKREDRRTERQNARLQAEQAAMQQKNQKEFEKIGQKELQIQRKVYYNNL